MPFPKGRINNKEKQASAGNWGHPTKFLKKHTKIDEVLIPETCHKAKKKKKKEKKPYICIYHCCPFCDTELPIIEPKNENRRLYFLSDRVKICPSCGAREVDECPACKRKTWVVEGVYKHQIWGCGFSGKKLERME